MLIRKKETTPLQIYVIFVLKVIFKSIIGAGNTCIGELQALVGHSPLTHEIVFIQEYIFTTA